MEEGALQNAAELVDIDLSQVEKASVQTVDDLLKAEIGSLSDFADGEGNPVDGEEPFNLQLLGLKGLGAVATADIPRGQCVLAEPAVVELPPLEGSLLDSMMEPDFSDRCLPAERMLRDLLERRSRDDQERFWNLADCYTDGKTAWGIFRTNAMGIGTGPVDSGVFPVACRLNHSCSPNVQQSWQPQEGKVRLLASARIQAGEELCNTYLDLLQTWDQRQASLLSRYDFHCECRACRLSGPERDLSDQRRRALQQLGRRGLGAVGLVLVQLALINKEFYGYPQMKVRPCFEGYQYALVNRQPERAKILVRGAYQNAVWSEGTSSALAKDLWWHVHNPVPFMAASWR